MTDVGDPERRRFRPGFRVRVLGFSAALLAAATIGGLLVQRAVLLERLDRQVAESLRQERRELESLASGRDPATGQRFGGDASAVFDTFLERNFPSEGEAFVAFVDGEPYAATRAPVDLTDAPDLVERWGSLTQGERGRLETGAGPVEYLAVPLRDGNTTAAHNFAAGYLPETCSTGVICA